jgi:hypothetical protein
MMSCYRNRSEIHNVHIVIGTTYTFINTVAGPHEFWINQVQGTGQSNGYTGPGLVNNGGGGTDPSGNNIQLQFTPTASLIGTTLFYNCEFHPAMTNTITFINPTACTTAAPTSTGTTPNIQYDSYKYSTV